jgi:hypothetical protein
VDLAFKILSTLAIPLLVIGVNLYTEVSVQKERLVQFQQHQTDTDSQVAAVNQRLNQVITTVQDTNGELREVRAVLGIIRERVDVRRPSTQRGQ